MVHKKTLMIVCGPIDYGGAGKIIKFVVNHLVNHGWSITIFSLYQKECSLDLDNRINFIGKDGAKEKRYKFLHWRIDELVQIRKNVKKVKPNILCAFVSDYVFKARLATLGINNIKFVGAERETLIHSHQNG